MGNIKKILREQLRIEERSIKLYGSFIRKIGDKWAKKDIKSIRDDEKEHVRLVKKMISIFGENGHAKQLNQ